MKSQRRRSAPPRSPSTASPPAPVEVLERIVETLLNVLPHFRRTVLRQYRQRLAVGLYRLLEILNVGSLLAQVFQRLADFVLHCCPLQGLSIGFEHLQRIVIGLNGLIQRGAVRVVMPQFLESIS